MKFRFCFKNHLGNDFTHFCPVPTPPPASYSAMLRKNLMAESIDRWRGRRFWVVKMNDNLTYRPDYTMYVPL